MNEKFSYNNEKEIKLINCQCEACVFFKGGKYSDICPNNKSEIVNNQKKCPKRKIKSILDL